MKRLFNLVLLSSLVALTAASFACGPTRGGGGGNNGNNGGGNNGGGNNGSTTPGNVWGGARDSGSEEAGFGFGQGQVDGSEGEQPGTVAASDCSDACDLIVECFGAELGDAASECPSACAQEALPSEVDCIQSAATCEDIVTSCVDVEGSIPGGPPANGEACDSACSAIISCFPELEGQLSECAQGCRAEATQTEVDCVLSNACGDILPECFGVDDFDVPTNNGVLNNGVANNGVVSGDCTAACDHVIECFAELIGPGEAESGRAECERGCQQEATPADIACIIEASCEEISSGACDSGTNNGSTNNGGPDVSSECLEVCPFLTFECSAFETEDSCYRACASWSFLDPGCIFEASCGEWESCL